MYWRYNLHHKDKCYERASTEVDREAVLLIQRKTSITLYAASMVSAGLQAQQVKGSYFNIAK